MKSIEDFVDLIRKTQMSHIYKPVMLQAILKRGGAATKAEIAEDIIRRDVLQQEHYRRNIIDQQPGWRLERDGAIKKDGETYRLNLNQNRLPCEACTRRVCKYFNVLFLRIFFIFFVAAVSGSANLYSISHRSHEIK